METYIIESNSCAPAHSISGDVDREIKFRKGTEFAVVLAAYYGGKGYSVHSEDGAIKKSQKLSRTGYSHKIIDKEGTEFIINECGRFARLERRY